MRRRRFEERDSTNKNKRRRGERGRERFEIRDSRKVWVCGCGWVGVFLGDESKATTHSDTVICGGGRRGATQSQHRARRQEACLAGRLWLVAADSSWGLPHVTWNPRSGWCDVQVYMYRTNTSFIPADPHCRRQSLSVLSSPPSSICDLFSLCVPFHSVCIKGALARGQSIPPSLRRHCGLLVP